jgi:hypothetical protein
MGADLMSAPKYPLECVAKARGERVQRAELDLAAAAVALRAADCVRVDAEQRREHHEAVAGRVRDRELAELLRGALRVQDLGAADRWASRDAAEGHRLRTEAEAARALAARAASTEHAARADLASRKAEAEVIEHDRSRWRRAQQKKIEAREEEASFEAWRPRK